MTVLSVLFENPADEVHGYEIAKHLKSHQSAYAVFRKLESHQLVTSRWDEVDGRRRRYYRLTGTGIDYCRELFHQPNEGGGLAWSPT